MSDHSGDLGLSKRVANLEDRVTAIERVISRDVNSGSKPADCARSAETDHTQAMKVWRVEVSNRSLHPADAFKGQTASVLEFDVTYHPDGLRKPTRSLKGRLEFSDLFGDLQFGLTVTISERIEPGQPYTQHKLGFQFSQFLQSHAWVQRTPLADMQIAFRVSRILYEDGTKEAFQEH